MLGPELGRGGMGQVHLAWDPMLRRQVALKRLLNADPLLALRFMREAQIQAKVDHPRICKVFEVSSEEGQPFIAMQYIQGLTLGEAREMLDLREKARIMAEVAGALHAAHRMGLVHRDIKPSNILLEVQEDGGWIPFILDFGLARDQSVADLTLSWGFVGTPAFMSPEQARAEEPSPASDIYSLGATFYALFGGHPPFEATTLVGLLTQQTCRAIQPVRRAIPGFPKDLDTILQKCLETEPSQRYASAFELGEDLQRWLAGEPIRARAVGPFGRGWRRIKRHKALSLSIAAGLTLALALAGWNIRATRQSREKVELAQRFGLQVREVEQILRIERMLPVHDIRPAEAQVRQRMGEIRATMTRLGSVSEGPGHYALGRGYFVLREFAEAQRELEKAWRSGFRSPEVAYALGTALMERYLAESPMILSSDAAKHEALRNRYAIPALAYFRQAKGQVQEDPAYGEAQMALLEGDYPRCVRKCREAFAAKPWMYEAKLLEAKAWNSQGGLTVSTAPIAHPSTEDGYASLDESRKAIDVALTIAPSEARIYNEELSRIIGLSLIQSDGGAPDPAIFERAERLYPKAMTIRPDNFELKNQWIYSRIRHGFVLLREGKDVRPLMRDTLKRAIENAPPPGAQFQPDLGNLHWLLADGQWRRGGDPLPELAEMDRCFPPSSDLRVQPACIKAEYLASRGRDPRPVLQEAENLLEDRYPQRRGDFYFFTIWGTVLLTRADWEWETGIDPLPTLDRAVLRLDEGLKLNPNVVYPCCFLAQIHLRKALRAMALGQNPGPALQSARTAALKGQAISTSHHRLHLALAEIHHAEAQDRLRQGQDPAPALAEARAALATGQKINPTDFRLHTLRAQVELTAARRALSVGRSPLEALSLAEAAARSGLGFKADYSRLWLALARAQRLRAEWALKRGEAATPWIAEGLRHLQRALALHPTLAESQAEKAALEGIQGGKDAGTREKLAQCLKRNPFLALDYRPS